MMPSTGNLLQNSQTETAAKIERLAKPPLEGNPAEISDAAIAQFCDWLWGEYQSLPSPYYKRSNSMSIATLSPKATQINWSDVIEYPQSGAKSKILLEDKNCRYMLMSLAASASIAEHTNPRNATVNVIEGQGVLTIEDEEISLGLGVFAFIPANARHSLNATTDLTFLLTLSERVTDSNH